MGSLESIQQAADLFDAVLSKPGGGQMMAGLGGGQGDAFEPQLVAQKLTDAAGQLLGRLAVAGTADPLQLPAGPGQRPVAALQTAVLAVAMPA